LWLQIPGLIFRVAVPALVNCEVPSRLTSVQDFASGLQKFTCPTVIAVVPALTEAVSVTTVPDATVETGLEAEVTASVVVVVALVWAVARFKVPNNPTARTPHHVVNLRRFSEPLSNG
jgi:hypothetical protein